MSKENRFSEMFKVARHSEEMNEVAEPGSVTASSISTRAVKKSRPVGKRSDPDFAPTTVFVRNDTKRKAYQRLLDDPEQKDLSDLVEQLLSLWLDERSHL